MFRGVRKILGLRNINDVLKEVNLGRFFYEIGCLLNSLPKNNNSINVWVDYQEKLKELGCLFSGKLNKISNADKKIILKSIGEEDFLFLKDKINFFSSVELYEKPEEASKFIYEALTEATLAKFFTIQNNLKYQHKR